jgi:hypothetical protein
MQTEIIDGPITLAYLRELAAAGFGDMVKAVVDVERHIPAVGGELHADEEAALLERGSDQPAQGNRSRGVEDPAIREDILAIVEGLVQG